jgi:hypothetical protein
MPSIGRFFPGNSVSDWSTGEFGKPGWVPNEPDSLEGTVGDQSVALTWTAGRSNGADITGYQIEKNDGSWSVAVANTGSATAAHTVTGLTNGQAYTFRVKGINSVGLSEVPSTASSSFSPLGAPLIPGTLSLAAGDPASTVLVLSWSAGSANGATITGYKIQYSTDGSTWSTATADTSSTATTYSITSLAQDTLYHVRVAAINSVGVGTYSNVPTLTTADWSPPTATGGTVATYTYGGLGYKSHKFTSSGTFTISANASNVVIDILVVGGGGHGGNGLSAIVGNYCFEGGGGGGFQGTKTGLAGAVTTYAVTVAAGGTASSYFNHTNASSGLDYQAGGGGAGGFSGTNGNQSYGGGGGGNGGYYHSSVGDQSGSIGYGQPGATALSWTSQDSATGDNGGAKYGSAGSNNGMAGGGGGAGGVGGAGASGNAGDGAAGISRTDFNHSPYTSAGGGGGMMTSSAASGFGGSSVGGDGAAGNAYNTTACHADTNSASGGGGSSKAENSTSNGAGYGQGGSGFVIVRYRTTA